MRIADRKGPSVAALVLAASATGASVARGDAALFDKHCAMCHARAESLARSLKGQTLDEKSSQLDAFLKTHHASDAQVRMQIVTYLVGLSAK